MKRLKVFVIIFGVLLVLALSAGLFFRENYLILDGTAYQKDVTSLDLSGKTRSLFSFPLMCPMMRQSVSISNVASGWIWLRE